MSHRMVNKTLEILELISTSRVGFSLNDIAERLRLPKSSVHNLLQTLLERGYLERSPRKHYRLSIKMFQIGSRALEYLQVKEEALSFLKMLAQETSETAHLAILKDGVVVIIEKVESSQSVRASSPVGTVFEPHAPATGKTILAFTAEPERQAFISRLRFTPFTNNTLTTRDQFQQELEGILERGYGIDNEEVSIGTRCIAAPIFDYTEKVIAAIGITCPKDRLTEVSMEEFAEKVVSVAVAFSRHLGSMAATEARIVSFPHLAGTAESTL